MGNVCLISCRARLCLRWLIAAQLATFGTCAVGWSSYPAVGILIIPFLVLSIVVLADDSARKQCS